MRSVLDNYNNLVDIDRIIDVYHNIRINSKHKDKLVSYELFFSCNIITIYNVLLNKCYRHQKYNIFLLKGPKYRIIMSEAMSDKIVNHLVSKYVLFPLLESKLIPMNVATRSGRGTKLGIFYIKKYINKLKMNSDKFYVLKCDVFKYFYSIDHDILFDKLRRIINDKDLLDILREIISSTDREYVNEEIDKVIDIEKKRIKDMNLTDWQHKIGDLERIPLYKKGKGLPIGNMTSQILAIFYLNEIDHFIKEKLRIKCYVRYMDDLILIHPDREYLKYCLSVINEKLVELKLKLNDKTQIVEIHQGFSFFGYKFKLKDKRLYILINSKTKRRIVKKIRYMGKKNTVNRDSIIASYKGYLMNANSGSFRYKHNIDK